MVALRYADRAHIMNALLRMDDDTVLTPREVADLFHVNAATPARWEARGVRVARTPTGQRRYPVTELRLLLLREEVGR